MQTGDSKRDGAPVAYRDSAEARQILETLPAAAYLCDREGLITYFNARAARLWGRAPKLNDPTDRFCGSFRLYSPDGAPIRHEECWMALALREGREYLECEIVIERPDGSRRFVTAHASPFCDKGPWVSGAVNVLVDVTDRKRMEVALRDEEARKSAILNSALDAIITVDHEGRIADFNPAAIQMFGYGPEEVIGRTLAELVCPPHSRNGYWSLFEQFLRTGEGDVLDRRVEQSAQRQDGGVFPVELTITMTRLREKPPLYTAFLRDLSDQKQIEQARQETEQRFTSFMRHLPAAAWIKDVQGRYVFANDHAQQVFGTSLEQLRDKTDLEIFPPETAKQFQENDRRARENRRVLRTVEQLEHEDGIVHESVVTKFPILNAEGKVVLLGGVAVDVTEQRQAVQALRESEAKLRGVLDHTRACIFAKDLAGRYILANKSTAKLFGWPDEHFGLGRTDHELHPQQQAEAFVANDRMVLEGGKPLECEEVVECANDPRTYLVSKFPLRDANGHVYAVCGIASDITDRKRAEAALRNSEERYRRLAELTPVAVYTCQAPEGEITYFNKHAAHLWGREPKVGDTDERFCGSFRLWRTDGTLLPHEQTPMAVALREGREFRNESVIIQRPDGTQIHVLVNIDPIRDDGGRVVAAINAFHDTTALNRAHESLRESERRLATLVSNLPGMAYRCRNDENWSHEFVSDGVIAITGLQPEEFTSGKIHWKHIQHPEDETLVVNAVRGAVRQRRPFQVEYRVLHKDGSVRWVLEQGEGIFDSEDKLIALEGFVADITDRKQADAALKAKEAELELITGTTPVILSRCSRDLRYLFSNRAAAAQFNLTPTQVIGRPIADVMGEQTFAVIKPYIDQVLQGQAVEFEAELPYLGAGPRWVRVNYVPERDETGEVVGWIASIVDITERKQAEAALQEANRRKDEFLAMLAHELRNPLAPIRTGLELMTLVKNDPVTMEEIRGTMERQTRQLITLVDDLLDVSRITRGRLELRKCRVRLADVVQSAVEAARPLVDEASHHLAIELPEEPLYMDADPNRLAQVLSNLLNNASKYTPEGGRIWLTAQHVGDGVAIRIRDTGIGIPAEMFDRVFEMFTQIGGPQEQGYTGLGIGLTLVKTLVEMHGGSIEVQSDGVKQGSTFTVRLPLLADMLEDEVQPARQIDRASAGARLRVLVVDDNEAAARMLSMVVKTLGNDVRTASDGQQAVDLAAEFRPDVVLMDLGMPTMNGYDAARLIRRQPWGREIVLVALTGWGQDEYRQRTREAGFDHHFVKPAEPAELQQLFADLR